MRLPWPAWAAIGVAAAVAPLPLVPWRGAAAGKLGSGGALAGCTVCVDNDDGAAAAGQFVLGDDLAEHFNRLGQVPPRLLVADQRIGSFVFYLDASLRDGLKPGQVEQIFADRPPQLHPGDVLAVPAQKLPRIAKYLGLSDAPCESVGQYRLYFIKSPIR